MQPACTTLPPTTDDRQPTTRPAPSVDGSLILLWVGDRGAICAALSVVNGRPQPPGSSCPIDPPARPSCTVDGAGGTIAGSHHGSPVTPTRRSLTRFSRHPRDFTAGDCLMTVDVWLMVDPNTHLPTTLHAAFVLN